MLNSPSFQIIIMSTLILLGGSGSAYAGIEVYNFSNQELQTRFENLSQELRCPKCQNQNLAGSDSLIANDLRSLIKQQLEQGRSDAEIKSYLVARYGDFILYKPPFKPSTLLLWSMPWFAFLLGIIIILRLRRSNKNSPINHISKSELEQLVNKTSKRIHSHD
jgi:cytochrome c-type biogenesis protein CcmH